MKDRLSGHDKSGKPHHQPSASPTPRTVDSPLADRPDFSPLDLTPGEFLRLQRTIGNQEMRRLLARTGAQAPQGKVSRAPSGMVQRLLMTKSHVNKKVSSLDDSGLEGKLDEIKDKLWDYHYEIKTQAMPEKTKKAIKQVDEFGKLLDAVTEACNAYIEAYTEAKLKREEQKSTTTKTPEVEGGEDDEDSSSEEEEKLQEQADVLAKEIKEQVTAERNQIQKIADNADSYTGLLWATALAFSDMAAVEKDKLTGEPKEVTKEGSVVTEHVAPKVESPRKPPPTPQGATTKYTLITVKAGEGNPFRTVKGAKPALTDLYEAEGAQLPQPKPLTTNPSQPLLSSTPKKLPPPTPLKKLPPVPQKPPSLTSTVSKEMSSTSIQENKPLEEARYWFDYPIDKPVPTSKLIEDTLFIDGTPTLDDIRQGQIGDCYFLAAAGTIVQKDPGKLKQIITAAGGKVRVLLFRYDSGGDTWQLKMVEVDQTLVRSKGEGGVSASGFKVAEVPIHSDWYVKLEGTKATVHRVDYFEAGLWAPLLEKAYARFAQEYGQYGGQVIGNEKDKPAETCGYEIVEGGHARFVYNLFYGFETKKPERDSMTYSPEETSEDNNVTRNATAVKRLLQVQGKNLPPSTDIHLTASPSRTGHVKRCFETLKQMENSSETKNYLETLELDDKENTLKAYQSDLGEFKNKLNERDTKEDADKLKAEELQPLAESAQKLAAISASWMSLFHKPDPTRPKIISDFFELTLDISTIGTDHSTGQRFVYSRHEYAVQKVVFKNEAGEEITNLKQALPPEELRRINPIQSTVTLYNPHHANTPNPTGKDFTEKGKDGVFDLTLDQFFRHFDTLDVGVVRKSK